MGHRALEPIGPCQLQLAPRLAAMARLSVWHGPVRCLGPNAKEHHSLAGSLHYSQRLLDLKRPQAVKNLLSDRAVNPHAVEADAAFRLGTVRPATDVALALPWSKSQKHLPAAAKMAIQIVAALLIQILPPQTDRGETRRR
jgi:hypothetical protein